MGLYVKTSDIVTSSYREDKPYGDWYSYHDFSIEGVYTRVGAEYTYGVEEINVQFDAKEGDLVYVLYMIYDTGDSFGRAHGLGEVFWVFNDEWAAEKARREVVKNSDQYSVEFDDGFGKMIKLSNPGAGYFETIQSIEVKPCLVEM